MASESASRAFMSDAKELVDAGQFGKAIEVLQEGLKKFPKTVSARVLLGEIYRTSGDLDLARAELEQVIKAAPDNFAACRKLALVYRDLGDKRSEEHTSELQSHSDLVCRLLLEKKKPYEGNGLNCGQGT